MSALRYGISLGVFNLISHELLRRRSRLNSCLEKRTQCYRFMVLDSVSDAVSAVDWLSQTHNIILIFHVWWYSFFLSGGNPHKALQCIQYFFSSVESTQDNFFYDSQMDSMRAKHQTLSLTLYNYLDLMTSSYSLCVKFVYSCKVVF